MTILIAASACDASLLVCSIRDVAEAINDPVQLALTALATLVGAAFGALVAWWFALDLRKRDQKDREAEREQAKADREAEREQDRLDRGAARQRAHRDEMRAQWARLAGAIAGHEHADRDSIFGLMTVLMETSAMADESERKLVAAVRDASAPSLMHSSEVRGDLVAVLMARVESDMDVTDLVDELRRRVQVVDRAADAAEEISQEAESEAPR